MNTLIIAPIPLDLKLLSKLGRGGGLVVTALTLYNENPKSSLVFQIYLVIVKKIKRLGWSQLRKHFKNVVSFFRNGSLERKTSVAVA